MKLLQCTLTLLNNIREARRVLMETCYEDYVYIVYDTTASSVQLVVACVYSHDVIHDNILPLVLHYICLITVV